MEQGTHSGETPKQSGPRVPPAPRSEASGAAQAAEERGHDARRLPSGLGSERKKGLRLGVSSTKLCSQLANAQGALERRGLGAPGPRQPGKQSPRRASYAARRPRGARALWRPRSLTRSPAPHPPPARSALRRALRRRRRRRRPLPAGHAPAETRAVSWTAAPALPISAARPAAPAPRGSRCPRAARDPGHRGPREVR